MDRSGICAIGVMAKAPKAGFAKTRLCPPLSPAQAAELSAAFLRDITENISLAARQVPIQGYIAFAPAGDEALFNGHLADGTGLVLADGATPMPAGVQGFGRCLLHAAQALFSAGFGTVCLLNADGPTLPTACLVTAACALRATGERIVLGPSDDGGYYLIGMQRPHAHLFADIAWSTSGVADATRERVRSLGLDIVELPTWYDIDDAATLQRLADGDPPPAYVAPATRACLARFGLVRVDLAAQ